MAQAAFKKIEEGLKEAVEASKTINLATLWCTHCRVCHISYDNGAVSCARCGGEVSESVTQQEPGPMCCAPIEWEPNEKPNGECPECGAETVDGEAYEQCFYSPVECEKCNHRPCDGSC